MNKRYLDYLIIALIIIIVVALVIVANKRVKESFTELYFTDYLNLPKYTSDPVNVSFAIHNLENKDYDYDVVISEELYYNNKTEESYSNVELKRFNVALKKDETKLFSEQFSLDKFEKAKIKVAIKNQTQEIYFWTLYVNEPLKYDFGYGGTDCLKSIDIKPFTKITIYAKGSYAKDWPEMLLWFDGRLIRTLKVETDKTQEYSFDVDGSKGKHIIDISFTNDYYNQTSKEDRNLYIEKIKINNQEIMSQNLTRDLGSKGLGFDCQNTTNSGTLYSIGNIRLSVIAQ